MRLNALHTHRIVPFLSEQKFKRNSRSLSDVFARNSGIFLYALGLFARIRSLCTH